MPSSDDFETILTTYLDDMYALAYQLTGSPHNAEDLVQDLFINLSLKRYQEREIRRPKAWLATILYRLFIDQWRRHKRSPVIYGYDEELEQQDPHNGIRQRQNDPLQQLEMTNQQQRAMRALNTLNERQRQVMILHELEGYTLLEICQIMDLPLGTAKSNLHRAREKVQVFVENEQHAQTSAKNSREPTGQTGQTKTFGNQAADPEVKPQHAVDSRTDQF